MPIPKLDRLGFWLSDVSGIPSSTILSSAGPVATSLEVISFIGVLAISFKIGAATKSAYVLSVVAQRSGVGCTTLAVFSKWVELMTGICSDVVELVDVELSATSPGLFDETSFTTSAGGGEECFLARLAFPFGVAKCPSDEGAAAGTAIVFLKARSQGISDRLLRTAGLFSVDLLTDTGSSGDSPKLSCRT